MIETKEKEIEKTIKRALASSKHDDDFIVVFVPLGRGKYECVGSTLKCENCFAEKYDPVLYALTSYLKQLGYDETCEEMVTYAMGTVGYTNNEEFVLSLYDGYGRQFSVDYDLSD